MPTISLSSRCNIDFLKDILSQYFASIQRKPFIFTLDADDLADWSGSIVFDEDGKKLLQTICDIVFAQPNLELFHFTPSPAYCPHTEAKQVWDAVREHFVSKYS